jgi:tetratricopeptide (TPR) repeat protein
MSRTSFPWLLFVAFLIALQPRHASSQVALETKQPFAQALIEVMEAMPGRFGDEGRRLAASIDALEAGLQRWDASIRSYEAAAGSELQLAAPPAAASVRALLGAMYLERGRLDDAAREFEAAGVLDSNRADVQVFRGLTYDAGDKKAEAAAAFRSASLLAPGNPIVAYLSIRRSLDAEPPQSQDVQRARQALRATHRERLEERGSRSSPFMTITLLEEQALDEPEFPLARYAEGFALLHRRQYERAVARLREDAAMDPLTTDPWIRSEAAAQAVAAMRNGDLEAAATSLNAALQQRPTSESSEAHRVLGMAYWIDRQHGKSVEQFRRAIELNPDDERSRLALGDALYEAGAREAATQALEDTLKAIPNSAAAHWKLGRMYQALHREGDALRHYERAAAIVPLAGTGAMYGRIGRLYLGAAMYDRAALAFSRQVDASPNDPQAHRQLGDVLVKLGRPDEAMDEFIATLLIDPADADANLAVGQIYLGAGQYAEAVTVLRHVVSLAPKLEGAHYALAAALIRAGNTTDGERELRVVENLQAERVEHQRRGYEINQLKLEAGLLARDGDWEKSADLWSQVVAREPDLPSNHVGLARALAKSGRHELAIQSFGRAIDLGAGFELHQDIAAEYEMLGRLEERDRALATYQRLKQAQLHQPAAQR